MHVRLDGLGHHFPDAPWLFRGLSDCLQPDRSYALVGPSGTGKSTLMSLIAGWVTPAEGSVATNGVDKTSWVFQSPHGVARRTALDHVVFPLLSAGTHRADAEPDAMSLLQRFDLEHVAHRDFRFLSGGEAQRLMLARAIAAGPQLLLIDEPTAQLDATTAAKVNAVLAAMTSPERVVVVATHAEATKAACTDCIDLAEFNRPATDTS